MTLLLRKSSAQARIEGWDPRNRSDDDYAAVDETRVGRIYRELIHGEPKWLWFLQTVPAPPPNSGHGGHARQGKVGARHAIHGGQAGEVINEGNPHE